MSAFMPVVWFLLGVLSCFIGLLQLGDGEDKDDKDNK